MHKHSSKLFIPFLVLVGLFAGVIAVNNSPPTDTQIGVGLTAQIGMWHGAPCPDVLVIGARGSGESPQGDSSVDDAAYAKDATNGMGGFNFDMYRHLKDSAPDITVRYEGVQYAAEPIPGWPNTPSLTSNPAAYMANVTAGAGWMTQEIGLVDVQCQRRTKFVLAGYSQGAWVVHKVLHRLSPERLEQVVGVVLFGDPLFQGGSSVNRVNQTTAIRNGVAYGADFANLLIPAMVKDVTGSYCNVTDPICQSRVTSSLFAGHATYKANGSTKKAAEFIRPFLPGPPAPQLPEYNIQTKPVAPPVEPADLQSVAAAPVITMPTQQPKAQPIKTVAPPSVQQVAPPPLPLPVEAVPSVSQPEPIYTDVSMDQACVNWYGEGHSSQYQDPNDPASWVCMNSYGEIVGGLRVQEDFCSWYGYGEAVLVQDERIPAYWWKCRR